MQRRKPIISPIHSTQKSRTTVFGYKKKVNNYQEAGSVQLGACTVNERKELEDKMRILNSMSKTQLIEHIKPLLNMSAALGSNPNSNKKPIIKAFQNEPQYQSKSRAQLNPSSNSRIHGQSAYPTHSKASFPHKQYNNKYNNHADNITSSLENNIVIKPTTGCYKQIDYRFETDQQIQTQNECQKIWAKDNIQKKNNSFSSRNLSAGICQPGKVNGVQQRGSASQACLNSNSGDKSGISRKNRNNKLGYFHCDAFAIRPSCDAEIKEQIKFQTQTSNQVQIEVVDQKNKNKNKSQGNIINCFEDKFMNIQASPTNIKSQNSFVPQKKAINHSVSVFMQTVQDPLDFSPSVHNLRPSRIRCKRPIFGGYQKPFAKECVQQKLPEALKPYVPKHQKYKRFQNIRTQCDDSFHIILETDQVFSKCCL